MLGGGFSCPSCQGDRQTKGTLPPPEGAAAETVVWQRHNGPVSSQQNNMVLAAGLTIDSPARGTSCSLVTGPEAYLQKMSKQRQEHTAESMSGREGGAVDAKHSSWKEILRIQLPHRGTWSDPPSTLISWPPRTPNFLYLGRFITKLTGDGNSGP